MTQIAVLDDWQGVASEFADWSTLPKHALVSFFHDHVADRTALIERLKPFEVVCVMRERTPLPREVIEALPNLKLIVTTGPRNASIDVKAAAERGVTVCGTGGRSHPTPELTWGLILALARHIPEEHENMRRGGWQTTIGRGLKGLTLGVLGLGRLGSRVAQIGRAFEMNLIAWSQNLTAERAAEQGARLVSREALFREADVLTIHLILSQRTRGLVGAAELALMKPSALLINTSRGPIVDEAALVEALRERRIAGAGLDVYATEPLPRDHALRDLDNVVLTPHLGYVTADTYAVFYPETVECIAAWLAGNPVRVIRPA